MYTLNYWYGPKRFFSSWLYDDICNDFGKRRIENETESSSMCYCWRIVKKEERGCKSGTWRIPKETNWKGSRLENRKHDRDGNRLEILISPWIMWSQERRRWFNPTIGESYQGWWLSKRRRGVPEYCLVREKKWLVWARKEPTRYLQLQVRG